MSAVIQLLIDGEACPVKDEAERGAGRYGLKTLDGAKRLMNIHQSPLT